MRQTVEQLPVLILNPWNRCNCRCAMCDIWRRDSTQSFGLEDLRAQLPAIRRMRVEWVVFTGGEPLMQPELFAMCAMLRAEGIRVTILSSGLLVQRHAEKIVTEADELIVSLDGPCEVHDRIRNVRGAFAALRDGVAAVRRLDGRFPLAARCTVQRINCGRLVETVAAARELGLDSISFLAADTHSDAFDHRLPMSDDIGLRGLDLEALDREIAHLVESGDCGGFVREGPGKLRRIVQHFRVSLGLAAPVAPACNAPWKSAVVEADGTMRPCFFHAPVGIVSRERAFDEVLNSEAAVAFRESLDVAENDICQRCVCSLNYRSQ